MVEKLVERARAEIPDLHLELVDITERPEVALKYGVLLTPAVAVNGELAAMGIPHEGALLERLRRAAGQ